MVKTWRIEEFYGLDQSKDGSLCNEGTSPDMRNMDTSDGNLRVANGYVKHLDVPVPGKGAIRRLAIMKLYNEHILFGIGENDEGRVSLWSYDPTEGGYGWVEGYTYPEDVKGTYWDILQCNIGEYDYLLFACGEHQMVKWDGTHREAELFGSGETFFETTVSAFSGLVLTVADEFTKAAGERAKAIGIVINGVTSEVDDYSVTNKTFTLKKAPSTAPAVGNPVKIRGGLSTAKVNYVAMHYSRLFSAGDPEAPNRLYYSQIAGDGRTIEDWGPDEASPNSAGGHVEVGDTVGDPIIGLVALSTQLLIFKRYSIYRLLGDRPSNYTVERVDAEIERMSHTSVTMHSDIAFYLTPQGIYYFNNITVQPMPDFRNIKGFMNGTQVSRCKACENDDKLYFSCFKGSGNRDYDNHIIVYDIRRRTYTIRDGFELADLVSLDGKIYMLGSDRYIYRFNEGKDYNGKPIHAYWQTQKTDWQSKSIEKQVDEIYLRGAGESFLLHTLYGDQMSTYQQNIVGSENKIMEIRPNADYSRMFQFELENINGSYFELQGGMEVYMKAKDRPR